MSESERFLEAPEVAALFEVDVQTIARWTRQGKLSGIRTLEGRRLYPREGVLRVFEQEKRALERFEEPPPPWVEPPEAPRPRTRSEARRRALEVLHAGDVADDDPRAQLRKDDQPYTRALVEGVWTHLDEIDAVIRDTSQHWALERMPVVDRNVIRLGVFELLHRDDVPAAVCVHEAVELVKLLSTEESGRFVNGVLGRVARERPRRRAGGDQT